MFVCFLLFPNNGCYSVPIHKSPGVEAGLERLKPHREGLLVPIIQEYRKRSGHTVEGSRKQKEDGRVNFITSLLASNNELSDDTITAVAIVSICL